MAGYFSLLGFWEPWGVGGLGSSIDAPLVISGLSLQTAMDVSGLSIGTDLVVSGLEVG